MSTRLMTTVEAIWTAAIANEVVQRIVIDSQESPQKMQIITDRVMKKKTLQRIWHVNTAPVVWRT
jgi:hypothetical protein